MLHRFPMVGMLMLSEMTFTWEFRLTTGLLVILHRFLLAMAQACVIGLFLDLSHLAPLIGLAAVELSVGLDQPNFGQIYYIRPSTVRADFFKVPPLICSYLISK